MNREEYRIMYGLEDIHWWCGGMRKIYFNLLNKFYKNSNKLIILDTGCGTGNMLEHFKKYGSLIGMDISEEALYFCRLRGHKRLIGASVTSLPFVDKSFDLIAALGVICQLEVKDDLQALEEFYRVLRKEGRVILQVPAYNFLKSEHDKAVYTRYRYTKDEIKIKMEQIGFRVEKITYINTILFPLIALLRLMKRMTKPNNLPRSDLKPTSVLVNRALIFVLTMEANLLKFMDFPFGLSILCIARK